MCHSKDADAKREWSAVGAVSVLSGTWSLATCDYLHLNVKFSSLVWQFLRKLNIELPYDPTIPLLGISPKEVKAGA